jgi:hypothetical protein
MTETLHEIHGAAIERVLDTTAPYKGLPSEAQAGYPDWTAGEQKAIEYAARDLVHNFTATTFEFRLRVLHDLITLAG